MKALKRLLAIGLVLALLGVAGFWLVQTRSASQATVDTGDLIQIVEAQKGSIDATISVVGELYAPQNETLSFDRASSTTVLQSLDVAAGAVVQAGQQLATIDPSTYQQALDQARSDLQEAETTLADLQTPATKLELARADLAVAKAKLAVQKTGNALDELENPDIDQLQADVADAQLSLTKAQSNLLAAQDDDDYQERLSKLQEVETDYSEEFTRLANETYSDTYYQDRLRVAYNKLMNAQDARMTAEIQQQISLLQAQMQVRQSEQKLAAAQEALAEARAGSDDLDLAVARQAVAQAEADQAKAQEARAEMDAGADAVDLAAAQADAAKKRLAVADAEADLAGATLAAPFAGTILSTDAAAGDRVASNTSILTIANLDVLQVVAAVDETTIRQVDVGQPATITFDAYPEQTFTGEVLSVPLQGTLQGDVMVYDVPISLPGAEEVSLLVGMTANVEIQVGNAEDVLLIPTMALQTLNGMYQVLIPNAGDPAGDPVAVPVQVGLSNGAYTEIVSGLNPGDQVVVQLSSTDSSQSDFRSMRQMMDGGNAGPPAPPGN